MDFEIWILVVLFGLKFFSPLLSYEKNKIFSDIDF